MGDDLRAEAVKEARAAYRDGTQPPRRKCCGKCAFRRGSQERQDPWGWLRLAEHLTDGGVFFCHEGVPGHHQQIDGEPLRICAGFHAMREQPIDTWMRLAEDESALSPPNMEELTMGECIHGVPLYQACSDCEPVHDCPREPTYSEIERLRSERDRAVEILRDHEACAADMPSEKANERAKQIRDRRRVLLAELSAITPNTGDENE